MLKTTEIKLSRLYELHGTSFDTVSLQEPNASMFWELGNPQEWIRTEGDVLLLHTHEDVLGEYIDRCICQPFEDKALPIAAIDAIRVSKAMLNFFREPEKAPATSNTPSDTSSLNEGGDPKT